MLALVPGEGEPLSFPLPFLIMRIKTGKIGGKAFVILKSLPFPEESWRSTSLGSTGREFQVLGYFKCQHS